MKSSTKTKPGWQDMTDEALVKRYGRLYKAKPVATQTNLDKDTYYSLADLLKLTADFKHNTGCDYEEFGIKTETEYYGGDNDCSLYLVARRHQTVHEQANDIRKALKSKADEEQRKKAVLVIDEAKERETYERLRKKFESATATGEE